MPGFGTMKKKNFSDWAVAVVVIICSVILLLALGFALSGTMFGAPNRTLRANFHDVIGINISANVKYAGALAGRVIQIRMLSQKERIDSGDPRNAVQVVLALNSNVPELPQDITVGVAADTLLSDKLIVIGGGTPTAPPLPDDAVVQGISPVSFDKLVRNVDGAVDGLTKLMSGSGVNGSQDLFARLHALLTSVEALFNEAKPMVHDAGVVLADAGTLMKDAQPVVKDVGSLVTETRQLIADNKAPITQTVATLNRAVGSLDQIATRGVRFLDTHEKGIATTLSDFRVTMENLKIAGTYARFLTRSLSLRPQQLLWGNRRAPELPSEESILRSSRPVDLQ